MGPIVCAMRVAGLLLVGLALCGAMPTEKEAVSGAVEEMSGLLGADDTDVVQQAFDTKRQETLNLPKELAALERDAEGADMGEADLSLKVDKAEVNKAVDEFKKTGKMPKLNTKTDRMIAADHTPEQIELNQALRDAKHTEVTDMKAMNKFGQTLDDKQKEDTMEKHEVGGVMAQAKAARAASAALNNKEEAEEQELGESEHEPCEEADEEAEPKLGEGNEAKTEETPAEKKLDSMAMKYKQQEKQTLSTMAKDEHTYVKNVEAQKKIDAEMAAVKAEAKKGLEANAKAGSTDELGESVDVGNELDGLAEIMKHADSVLNDDKNAHKSAEILSEALDEHGDDLLEMGMNALKEALF